MDKKTIPTVMLLMLASLIIIIIIILLLEWNYVINEAAVINLVLLPILPVFLGALLAYQVQQITENRKIEDSRVDAIRRNMVRLTSILNEVAALNYILTKSRVDDDDNNNSIPNALQLPATIPPKNCERILPSELALIMENESGVNLLTELSTFQITFDMMVFSLQERNSLYRDFLLPALAEQNITPNGIDRNNQNVVRIMNSVQGKKLAAETANLHKHVPGLLQSGLSLENRLAKCAKALFPNRTFFVLRTAFTEAQTPTH